MYLYSMLPRTRSIGVGGWNVSEYLKQAMSWQETTESGTATVSSLDTTGNYNKKPNNKIIKLETLLKYSKLVLLYFNSFFSRCEGKMSVIPESMQRGTKERLHNRNSKYQIPGAWLERWRSPSYTSSKLFRTYLPDL